jgi:hypothetical protein
MTTAIIGTGGIGSAIARQLAAGGETLRLSSADEASARTLAAAIGGLAIVAADNRDALEGADTVVLALRFGVLKSVIADIDDPLKDKLVVVPSNPVGIDDNGRLSRLLPEGQSSGEVVAGWLPAGARLAMAFGVVSQPVAGAGGALLCNRRSQCRRASGAVDSKGRVRADEGRRGRRVRSTRGGGRPSRFSCWAGRGAVVDRRSLIAFSPRRGPWAGVRPQSQTRHLHGHRLGRSRHLGDLHAKRLQSRVVDARETREGLHRVVQYVHGDVSANGEGCLL